MGTLVQLPRASQRLVPQPQGRATRRPVLQQPSERPRVERQQASRPWPLAQQELPRQASPPASSRRSLSRLLPLLQLPQQQPGRGNASAPVPRASGQSSSSASFFP